MAVFFEDVEVGTKLPELVKEPVSDIQLVRYSGASGDFNPIHTVPVVAQSVGLEGTIAHGMLIMAFAGQFLTVWGGAESLRKFKVRFSGMTKPTESVVCRGQITEKISGDSHEGLVSGKLVVKGVADDSLKVKGEFTIALPHKR
jgi:acyl dehydratase